MMAPGPVQRRWPRTGPESNQRKPAGIASSVTHLMPGDGVVVNRVVKQVGIATIPINPVAAAAAPVDRGWTGNIAHEWVAICVGQGVCHQNSAVNLAATATANGKAAGTNDKDDAVEVGKTLKGQRAFHQKHTITRSTHSQTHGCRALDHGDRGIRRCAKVTQRRRAAAGWNGLAGLGFDVGNNLIQRTYAAPGSQSICPGASNVLFRIRVGWSTGIVVQPVVRNPVLNSGDAGGVISSNGRFVSTGYTIRNCLVISIYVVRHRVGSAKSRSRAGKGKR